jgi:hypothetical protein
MTTSSPRSPAIKELRASPMSVALHEVWSVMYGLQK